MDWANLIGNYAFPIVMCAALFWKMNDQDKSHKEESKEFIKAIENNTEALVSITELLRKEKEYEE